MEGASNTYFFSRMVSAKFHEKYHNKISKYASCGGRRPEGSSFIRCYPKVGEGATPFPGQLRPLIPACWYSFIDLGRMKGSVDLSVKAGNRTRAARYISNADNSIYGGEQNSISNGGIYLFNPT